MKVIINAMSSLLVILMLFSPVYADIKDIPTFDFDSFGSLSHTERIKVTGVSVNANHESNQDYEKITIWGNTYYIEKSLYSEDLTKINTTSEELNLPHFKLEKFIFLSHAERMEVEGVYISEEYAMNPDFSTITADEIDYYVNRELYTYDTTKQLG